MTPSQKAEGYAKDVVAKKIPAGPYVRLACKRFLDDLKKKNWPYYYSPEKANKYVSFIERMPHVKGKWSAEKRLLKLEPWQCFIECNIFGWLRKDNNKRRFRESYEEIPRKNGKSVRLAARGIYMFCADGEAGAEVYSGATTEKQAYEIFRPAWMMTHKLKDLSERFGIEQAGNTKNPGPMFVMEDMSKFEVLIGKPGDGASPHCALVDEYHEHDTDHMVDTMRTGMGAREQPLLSIITTAGTNLGGPCYEKRKDIIKILEGTTPDETIFGIIYGLDKKDKWDAPAMLKKANPNYGISVFEEFLLAQLAMAKRSATVQNAFRTKHLDDWVGAKTAWMNMVAWEKQRKAMKEEDFVDCPCIISLDLSSQKDVTAINKTFDKDGQYFSFSKFFVPESAVEVNEKYREFVTAGVLEVTEGNMIDQATIEEHILFFKSRFKVKELVIDDWQADYMAVRLMERGLNVIKFPFRTRNVSEPMKHAEALVLAGKYFHDGNPMMTWMMGNVAAKIDIRGNIFPNKERPNDEFCKIDGAVTAIMSIARFILEKPPEPKYEMIFV